ncbi:hypothetical protein ACO0QE_001746 [Hanseniaspora vineae]
MSNNRHSVSNFSDLEPQKENISRIRSGRSASQLLESFQAQDQDLNRERLKFEKQILEEIEDADDPLELFLNYINWIKVKYPQGITTKRSGMLHLLERCLQFFKTDALYTNDPRYVKLWIWYIEVFQPTLNDKKDTLYYMLRHRIGGKLAVVYESLANVLWDLSAYEEAVSVLTQGLEANCRPLKRLQKQFDIFTSQYERLKIDTVPVKPVSDLNTSILGQSKHVILRDHERNEQSTEIPASRQKKAKLDIYVDDEDTNHNLHAQKLGIPNINSHEFPSKYKLSKENQKLAEPVQNGMKLKPLNSIQEQRESKLQNALLLSKPKTTIFSDSNDRPEPKYKITHFPNKNPERIDVNYDLLYPNPGQEFCLDEILAMKRNVYKKINKLPGKREILKEKPIIPLTSEVYRDETIQLRSPLKAEPKPSGIVSNFVPVQPASPTITMHSKNAMNEIYNMFNHNEMNHASEPFSHRLPEEENTEHRFEMFENFTQDFTKKSLDDLTEVKPFGKSPVKTPRSMSKNQKLKSFMTPLKDSKVLEHFSSPQRKPTTDLSLIKKVTSINPTSQPMLEKSIPSNPSLVVKDPLNDSYRQHLLSSTKSLNNYSGFHKYDYDLKMGSQLSRINKNSNKKNINKNPIINFQKTDDLYFIRGELGQGGYATVYLAESSNGALKALKVEKPPNLWEFYILRQISERLKGQDRILQSIILVDSLHFFRDESYLVLNYISQGTILDLINKERSKSSTGQAFNELLVMFFSVELMKVIENLHQINIIHGDLKPDNCMVRFESFDSDLGDYNGSGLNDWDKKGIFLIDFGRSFDMSILAPGTKFKANWKCDDQDCPEMRENKEWTFEADYYGLAGIIHCMLFGTYIKTIEVKGRYKLLNGLKRYWQKSLWEELFDLLLNSAEHAETLNKGTFPITSLLAEQRMKLEAYLKQNSNSEKLKNIIHDIEIDING